MTHSLRDLRAYGKITRMPIIKSAIKKVRKDKLRTARNQKRETQYRKLVREFRRTPDAKNTGNVFSALDKAVKVNLIHANKAARLKSRLAKLLSK